MQYLLHEMGAKNIYNTKLLDSSLTCIILCVCAPVLATLDEANRLNIIVHKPEDVSHENCQKHYIQFACVCGLQSNQN